MCPIPLKYQTYYESCFVTMCFLDLLCYVAMASYSHIRLTRLAAEF